MAKGYWIGHVDIADPQRYKEYVAANAEPLNTFGGRFLVRAGEFLAVEGSSRMRHVVVEFPTYQAAIECWKSPQYQAAIRIRQSAATTDLLVIEGYEGPQP